MSHDYYGEKLIVCYSGGKDSDVILRLAEECLGNDFEVLNSHTTVDAPQTVRHIEKVFKRCEEKGIKTIYKNRYPVEHTMWELIVKKHFPPTRIQRYCCAILKETGTATRLSVLGVRASESIIRQGREVFSLRGTNKTNALFFSLDHAEEVYRESKEINDSVWDCTLIKRAKEHADLSVNAIYDWTDEDVFTFIKDRKIELNPLYDMGFRRVGCVFCPLSRVEEKLKEEIMFPTYKQAYIRAFQQMLDDENFHHERNDKWKNGEDVYKWWIEVNKDQVAGQMSMFDEVKQ